MRDNSHIQSLERGLRILEIIGESSRDLSLTDIARLSGLNKSTVQRFLNTLTALGYVNREENKRYFLGTRVLSLGYYFLDSSSLVGIARPYVDELWSELGLSVNLAVLDHVDVLILYRKEVRRFFKFDIHAGTRLPAQCSGLGKAMLAGLEDAELKARINAMELEQVTPKSIVSKDGIWEDIMKTRETGFGISDQELSTVLYSIGVPLIDGQGRVSGAINVSLEAKDKDSLDLDMIMTKLKEKGALISRVMGFKGPYPQFPGKASSVKKL